MSTARSFPLTRPVIEAIDRAMDIQGVSVKDLAVLTSNSPAEATLYKILKAANGERRIFASTLMSIAAALDLNYAELAKLTTKKYTHRNGKNSAADTEQAPIDSPRSTVAAGEPVSDPDEDLLAVARTYREQAARLIAKAERLELIAHA